MGKRNTTLKELAAELSLSPATISLALGGKGDTYRIARETRRRIEEAADRLGYRPNHMARSMRRGKTDTIGVVFPDVSEAFMNRILAGIETVALEQGVSLMIATSTLDSSAEARNLDTLMDRNIDGLLLVPYAPFRGEAYDNRAIRRAMESGIPSVCIDRYLPGISTYAVIGADRDAARLATEKLIAAGCRRPAYLGFDLAITTLDERRRGFNNATKAAGLTDPSEEKLLTERNPDSPDIMEWLTELAGTGRFPDGFLVSTDGLALKLRWLLEKLSPAGRASRRTGAGRERSGPLIARFGEDSPYFPTGMISVRQPHEELGRRATKKLLALIAGEVILQNQQIEIIDMEIIDDTQHH